MTSFGNISKMNIWRNSIAKESLLVADCLGGKIQNMLLMASTDFDMTYNFSVSAFM